MFGISRKMRKQPKLWYLNKLLTPIKSKERQFDDTYHLSQLSQCLKTKLPMHANVISSSMVIEILLCL